MKRLLLVTAGLLLIAPDIAVAAQDAQQRPAQTRPGGGHAIAKPARPSRPAVQPNRPARPIVRPSLPGGAQPNRPTRPGRPQVQPPRPGGPQIQPPRPGTGGPQIQPPRPGTGGPQIQPPRPGTGGPQIQPPRPGRPNVRPPRPGRPIVRPPHRPGAGRPPQFRPVRGPSFRYPRGYSYRRWTIGRILPRLFLSNTYYYDNWAPLGVGAPPPGYRWIRYGPDLLLVRGRDARVVDVIYGAFY